MTSTNFHLAPPSKIVDGLQAVPIDIQTIAGTLAFDGAAQTGQGDVTLTFIAGSVDGCAIFDLRQTILEAWLDGAPIAVAQMAHHDFGGGTHAQLRILDSPLTAGSTHTLRLRYDLGLPQASTAGSYLPDISWSAGPRLTFNFGFTDLGAGRYLEAWVPANLIFDQFDVTLELRVLNTAIAHTVITNGAMTVLGTNHFRVQWAAHTTALSTLLEIRASDSLLQQTDVVTLPVSGVTVTIEAWKLTTSTVDLTAQIANIRTFLTDNENDIGIYTHGTRFVVFFHLGGMEYDGATTTGVSPLRHETFHSWWGRGTKPASQPDGWFDEAWNEYNMAGGGGSVPFNFADAPVELSPRNPWWRRTASASYTAGREFFEGLASLMTAAQLRGLMDEFYASRHLALATTPELEAHLLARSGEEDLVDAFHRFVYGLDDSTTPDLWLKDEASHAGADYWGGTFWDSPDLWTRRSEDGGTTHQAPEYGQDNWFHARVRNRGESARHFAVAFSCRPYAGFEFLYPDDFLPCTAAVVDFELGPGERRVVKARWPASLVPPEGTHACLLAAAIARSDHPAAGLHVWEHNNLAQKNTTVVDMVAGDWLVLPLVVFNRRREWLPWFDLVCVRPKGLESLRCELLYPGYERPSETMKETLDCGGGASPEVDYGFWTSRNPRAVIAARFAGAKEDPFPRGARGSLRMKIPFHERLMLGWRVWIPPDLPPGLSFSIHLVKRNPLGRRPQGGLTVQVRVVEKPTQGRKKPPAVTP